MAQSEISGSTEVYEMEEFISVRRWVGPDHGEMNGLDRDQGYVLLARSQVTHVGVQGHFLHLRTVSGGEYARRGTLKGLEQWWAKYGLVRIHNSHLVFLSHVRELHHKSRGPVVFLGSGAGAAALPISRKRFQEFKRLWEAHKAQ